MTVSAGSHVGSYEILSALGAGGMGEVYRARDTRLKRDVAVKVLREALVQDADRLARFQREAELLATLNHPNIAAVYGLEKTGAVTAIILELVEGNTLAELIARGPVAVGDALPLAHQIANALEAAHERGIIHRDLKPANIKVRPDGTVKVLDFGLAKALDDGAADVLTDPALSPTLTSPTALGTIMGTAAYMAPEQARGRAVDRRADIWAFGAVLYETLAGKRAFPGETVSDTLAAVLKTDPDWSLLPRDTPPEVRRLLERCLERDPRLRLQAIGEARIVLSTPRERLDDAPASRSRNRVFAASLLGAALALGAFAATAWIWTRPVAQAPSPIRKLDVMLDGLEVGLDAAPALSPDGERIVYRAQGQLWVRSLSEFVPKALPASSGARYPFWSPDSRQVAFVNNGKIWRVAVEGAETTPVGTVPSDLSGTGGGVWTASGELVLAGSDSVGLFAVPQSGGSGREILPLDKSQESDFHDVSELPHGRGFLFTVHRREGSDTIGILADGKRATVLQIAGESLRFPVYSPAGYLLYAREVMNPGVWAVSFSLSRLSIDGDPVLLVPGATTPTIGSDGTLAFVRSSDQPAQIVSIDRRGSLEPLDELPGQPVRLPLPFSALAASRDRERIAVALKGPSGTDLFSYDRVRRVSTRLTVGAAVVLNPTWSSDGQRVFFGSFVGAAAGSVYVVPFREASRPEQVLPPSRIWRWPCTVSPDGRLLVYAEGMDASTDLWVATLDGTAAPKRLTNTPSFRELDAKFSPDGRWIAYTSNASGRPEIYIRAFPGDSEPLQVSREGATMPAWSPDGREIFYRTATAMMSVKLSETRSRVDPSPPHQLFPVSDPPFLTSYAVTADAQRFLLVRSAGNDRVSVFLNWPAHVGDLARSK